jgi:hypothetical protein
MSFRWTDYSMVRALHPAGENGKNLKNPQVLRRPWVATENRAAAASGDSRWRAANRVRV